MGADCETLYSASRTAAPESDVAVEEHIVAAVVAADVAAAAPFSVGDSRVSVVVVVAAAAEEEDSRVSAVVAVPVAEEDIPGVVEVERQDGEVSVLAQPPEVQI